MRAFKPSESELASHLTLLAQVVSEAHGRLEASAFNYIINGLIIALRAQAILPDQNHPSPTSETWQGGAGQSRGHLQAHFRRLCRRAASDGVGPKIQCTCALNLDSPRAADTGHHLPRLHAHNIRGRQSSRENPDRNAVPRLYDCPGMSRLKP